MSERPASDDGFVLLDALLGLALLCVAGAAIVSITSSVLARDAQELDRSVALVMAQSLVRQITTLGPPPASGVVATDELFTYAFERTTGDTGVQGVKAAAIVAMRNAPAGTTELHLDFLLASSATGAVR